MASALSPPMSVSWVGSSVKKSHGVTRRHVTPVRRADLNRRARHGELQLVDPDQLGGGEHELADRLLAARADHVLELVGEVDRDDVAGLLGRHDLGALRDLAHQPAAGLVGGERLGRGPEDGERRARRDVAGGRDQVAVQHQVHERLGVAAGLLTGARLAAGLAGHGPGRVVERDPARGEHGERHDQERGVAEGPHGSSSGPTSSSIEIVGCCPVAVTISWSAGISSSS